MPQEDPPPSPRPPSPGWSSVSQGFEISPAGPGSVPGSGHVGSGTGSAGTHRRQAGNKPMSTVEIITFMS